ncbi:hypothetical protein ACHAWO_004860 [Cyclotella atomus]|uniref:CRAL-TRIO domain-containing protein n=1 Tax=Cyclotella atomus TaxID=382360 RepID=A0ABD3NJL5_9STRA
MTARRCGSTLLLVCICTLQVLLATDSGDTCTNNDIDICKDSQVDNVDVKTADQDQNLSSSWEFMNAFSKLGSSWSHVIAEYRSVISSADGKDIKGDVYAVNGLDEGLALIKKMVKEEAEKSRENEIMWTFQTSPLGDFGKTTDDLLLAFLRWSIVDNHLTNGHARDDNGCSLIGGINYYPDGDKRINVSKAFRRLTSYTHWMDSVSQDLLLSPLTYASISPSLEIFSIQITHDDCGRLVWWVDLGKTKIDELKAQSTTDTTRMFVYIAHMLFLDTAAQTKGLVVIDDMAEISFWQYMTMLPLKVGISVDRFLISVTPLKAKQVVMMHRPKWVEIAYSLLSLFLNERMKSRVTMVKNGDEVNVLNKAVGGSAFIPFGFANANGEISTDLIEQDRK